MNLPPSLDHRQQCVQCPFQCDKEKTVNQPTLPGQRAKQGAYETAYSKGPLLFSPTAGSVAVEQPGNHAHELLNKSPSASAERKQTSLTGSHASNLAGCMCASSSSCHTHTQVTNAGSLVEQPRRNADRCISGEGG